MFSSNPLYIEELNEVISGPLPWSKLRNTKILITGANGLIASFFVDCLMYRNKLYDEEIQAYALCRNREKAENRFKHYLDNDNFNLIIQDVSLPLNVDIDFDYMIHAASNVHPAAFATYPVDTIKSNVLGSINLLEYARKTDIKKFMFISSGEIYGKNESHFNSGLKEDYCGYIDCTNIRSAYPESKRVSESLCTAYEKQYAINTVIVRPCYVFGATMTDESSKADAQFIRCALNNSDIIMKSAGQQLRSYCYLPDAVSAMFYVLLSDETGGAYNIAAESCTITIREFAEILSKIADVNIVFENPDDIEKSGYSPVGNAVLNAENNNFIFMCADPARFGYHKFTASAEEHAVNAKAYQDWLNSKNIK